ncbi:MAG: acetyl-CoA decarbonylase/synthase complex subunit gamma [Candidatus Methanomethylicia archaeon]
MPKILRPLDVYKHLPGTNCGKCGETSCMAFASKLIERKVTSQQCTPLYEEPKYSEKLQKLLETIRPPIKEVWIGVEPNILKIGGKEVLYRHELTWRNQTAIIIDIHDEMPPEEIKKRVELVNNFKFIRIGKELTLDGIAIRCVSENPEKYAKTTAEIMEKTNKPIILCSLDSNILEEALIIANKRKPLIYTATKQNWKEIGELASKYKCPVAVTAENPATLKSLSATLNKNYNVDDIVLDPQIKIGNIAETLSTITAIRRAAIEKEEKELGYPIMTAPAAIWSIEEGDENDKKTLESVIASNLISRFTDLIILHTTDTWTLIPIVVWRDCIYTDPRFPPGVKPGLYEIGKPNEYSPVLVTSNFALTYHLVRDDVEKAGINAYLIIIDTEATSLQSSVAGRKIDEGKIVEAIREVKIGEKTKVKALILPGYAARLAGGVEDALMGDGWTIFVGPRDSGEIGAFYEKVFKPWLEEKLAKEKK